MLGVINLDMAVDKMVKEETNKDTVLLNTVKTIIQVLTLSILTTTIPQISPKKIFSSIIRAAVLIPEGTMIKPLIMEATNYLPQPQGSYAAMHLQLYSRNGNINLYKGYQYSNTLESSYENA